MDLLILLWSSISTDQMIAANGSLFAYNKLPSSRLLLSSDSIQNYFTNPVLTNGSERWILNDKEENCNSLLNKVLRNTFGLTIEDGLWRIKHNEEIRQQYKDPVLA